MVSTVDAWRKLRTYLGGLANLRCGGEVEPEGSILLTYPNLACPGFKVESDLLGDLFGRIRRREDLDANLGRLNKADGQIDLLTPLRREPRYIDGFDTIRGRDRALGYHDAVRQQLA
jgi:hypothetical protein